MTQTIPVTVEFNIQQSDALTWNIGPLMHEVRHALGKLLKDGESTVIDLRSLPLAPGEEDKLIAFLGEGEVHARLDALGNSDVYETAYNGVWLVSHYNDNDNLVSRFIEITTMPEILKSQDADIRDASERLADDLDSESFKTEHTYSA